MNDIPEKHQLIYDYFRCANDLVLDTSLGGRVMQ